MLQVTTLHFMKPPESEITRMESQILFLGRLKVFDVNVKKELKSEPVMKIKLNFFKKIYLQ